ncbi:phosphonate C-P lyase system protein PhnH [Paenibacillus koleovorans]|uniref:phosphonate C-P lyase system protein PhnH n=1 Tax=Paenibacillus koleovorans TaxID=121608 RepID=UPI000FDA0CCE|nr:phosphonate C-P lyase system protein PhnH [Paenibacillus koleovorans]
MPNVKELPTFDRVHDTQFIYRQLLEAMSRPGEISSLEKASSKLPADSPLPAMIACLAWTLLDGEVGFAVELKLGPGKAELEEHIRRQMFSRIQSVSQAEYLFVSGSESEERIRQLMGAVKRGSLIRPEDGATLFVLVEELASAGGEEVETEAEAEAGAEAGASSGSGCCESDCDRGSGLDCWMISGPGVFDERCLCVKGLSAVWLEERARVNAEYPMGVDMVLFTTDGKVVALPRTSVVKGVCG